MKKKNKAYVVFIGFKTGVFVQPWNVVERYINGYSEPKYKGYRSVHEAQKAWDEWQQQQVPEASR